MRRVSDTRWAMCMLLAAAVGSGCVDERSGGVGGGVLLLAPPSEDPLNAEIIEDFTTYAEQLTGETPVVREIEGEGFDAIERAAAQERAGLVVVFDAHRIATDRVGVHRMGPLGSDGFVLETEDVGNWTSRVGNEPGATVVLTAANAPLSRQFAATEVLRRLGVRFFHPEQDWVPVRGLDQLRGLARRPTVLHRGDDYTPDYEWRSWSFHGAHPLEALEAFSDANHPIAEARNITKWTIRNKGNRFKGLGRGVADEASRQRRADELEQMRRHYGFPRGAGITLHNEQQGANADIDPSSPTPVQEQIQRLVEERLAATPDARWFGIHFGPTEFTVTPDQETVQWINWAGRKALELRPGIQVEVNNHITGSQPVEHYEDFGCENGTNEEGKVDYYDLAFHTDPRLGANVHTVMFYPLEGPARVYNQKSFGHKLCLIREASEQGRPVTWFPEGSWWLSFDNPVPVYLPLYVWTRGRDIELIRPLLHSRGDGTVRGHRMFNSGQEWGYWQQDYAVGLWAWNSDATLEAVVGEMLDPLCESEDWELGCDAKAVTSAVLSEVMLAQKDWFLDRSDWQGRPGGLYAYFAGEDQADEIAAATGFEFRPVKVSFNTINQWRDDTLDTFEGTDLAALEEIATAHEDWLARLAAIRPDVASAGRVWLDEIVDGIEINHLRALQSLQLFRAAVAFRRSFRLGDEDPAAAAQAHWDAAQDVLRRAEEVIARREAAYRYPATQTHGGGLTPETAVENGTTYPYRVHTKTHLLTYWHNRNEQVRSLLEGDELGDAQSVSLVEALDGTGAPVSVTWPNLDAYEARVQIGDLPALTPPDAGPVDLGSDPGYWSVRGEFITDGRTVDLAGGVARTDVQNDTPAAEGVTLIEPDDPLAQSVLAGVFPALRWGWIDDPMAVVVAPDPEGDGSVRFDAMAYAPVVSGNASSFTTARVSIDIPVALSSGGVSLNIGLTETVISGAVGANGLQTPMSLDGRISIPDLVNALRELAGFDEAGALLTLSGILGFDPDNPPATVPYEARLLVE